MLASVLVTVTLFGWLAGGVLLPSGLSPGPSEYTSYMLRVSSSLLASVSEVSGSRSSVLVDLVDLVDFTDSEPLPMATGGDLSASPPKKKFSSAAAILNTPAFPDMTMTTSS